MRAGETATGTGETGGRSKTAPAGLPLGRMADSLRVLAMDAVERAQSGHPGMPMGMADVATVLFARHLAFDPARPDWPDRDRFILSAGHGSMLLYGLAHLTGYGPMTREELENFRQLGSITPGHPELMPEAGIETTTGPLGQGFGNSVGMALAERLLNARFGDDLVDHRVWVLASDGDLMEGVSHEAASLAGHLRLDRLCVLYDANEVTIDGPAALAYSEDAARRFAGYGWHVQDIDGHDHAAIDAALAAARDADRPSLVICRTEIGHGAPHMAGTAATHGAPLGEAAIAATRQALGWDHPPFEIPPDLRAAWRAVGEAGRPAREAWESRLAASESRALFEAALAGELPAGLGEAIDALKAEFVEAGGALATRKASGKVLDRLVPMLPELIGGSGDLTPSNNTQTADGPDIAPRQAGEGHAYAGRYIHYGVREHGMVAAMNGMSLHGGIRPYGGSFLVFTDYCRPSIRLAALMGQPILLVMTHDSIGLGEDGPTHQPVEHLAALRAMPGLSLFRPADPVELAECWQLALERRAGPSLLALTRQNVALLRERESLDENRAARGAYRLRAAAAEPARVTLLASGSEVGIAARAREVLEGEGIGTEIVSMPCWELFDAQPESYRREILPEGTLKIGIEAAAGLGWARWLGAEGVFIGMEGFGASAPYGDLYTHFGLTPERVAQAARQRLR